MKQPYAAPKLVEYGRLNELTLGLGGTLPDYNGNVTVNNTCDNSTFTTPSGTYTRISCDNEPALGS